jgi:hypothetical protein
VHTAAEVEVFVRTHVAELKQTALAELIGNQVRHLVGVVDNALLVVLFGVEDVPVSVEELPQLHY